MFKSNMIGIRAIKETDAKIVADSMRQAERDEIEAATGNSPIVALTSSIGASVEAYAVFRLSDDEPIALFGVVPLAGTTGQIWMLTSDEIASVERSFAKQSRKAISNLLTRYDRLFNLVDCRHRVSIAWIKFCRGEFHGKFDLNGYPFELFSFSKGD